MVARSVSDIVYSCQGFMGGGGGGAGISPPPCCQLGHWPTRVYLYTVYM